MSRPSVSYYSATVPTQPPRPAARGHVSTAVCVVGGGFAGLNTALGLLVRGVKYVVVLEAERSDDSTIIWLMDEQKQPVQEVSTRVGI